MGSRLNPGYLSTIGRRRFGVGLATAIVAACESNRPPAPRQGVDQEDRKSRALARDEAAVFTYAGERGAFIDTQDPDSVPEAARGLVKVTPVSGDRPPSGHVFVMNLKTATDGEPFSLSAVRRDAFEALALGQGPRSGADVPEGLEPPPRTAHSKGAAIVVYKTSWCGVCKSLEAYLSGKGVAYVAKDIEADRAAAAELQAKARAKGMVTKSVPVIDIGGELIVGFDRARLERLLAS